VCAPDRLGGRQAKSKPQANAHNRRHLPSHAGHRRSIVLTMLNSGTSQSVILPGQYDGLWGFCRSPLVLAKNLSRIPC